MNSLAASIITTLVAVTTTISITVATIAFPLTTHCDPMSRGSGGTKMPPGIRVVRGRGRKNVFGYCVS